jgi:hypothetical protein
MGVADDITATIVDKEMVIVIIATVAQVEPHVLTQR